MEQTTIAPVHLSLVIPAFNEEARIGKSLERVINFLRSQPYVSEVIIVDDGSVDGTADLVRERFANYDSVRICRQPVNQGKGAAVRAGMLEAKGNYLFFSDADLSVPIESLPAFFSPLENGRDIAIGTRQKAGAKIELHQPWLREYMGKAFTRLSRWILGLPHSDFTCGFKGFRREAAREIFSRQRLSNWSFDPEILYLARLKGYRVSEIPVIWRNDGRTKVRLWKDTFTSFLGLLRIRLNHYLGKYR